MQAVYATEETRGKREANMERLTEPAGAEPRIGNGR